MTDWNKKYTEAYISYKATYENLENWYSQVKYVNIILLSDYLDTKESKERYDTEYLKGIKSLFKTVQESFKDIVKPAQYKIVLLNKLEECSGLDFTDTGLDFADKSLLAYNLFTCTSIADTSDKVTKDYNIAVEKFNKAVAAVPNIDYEKLKTSYNSLDRDLESLKVISSDDNPLNKACKEQVDDLLSSIGIEVISRLPNKKTFFENQKLCTAHSKLIGVISKYQNDTIEIKKCANLEFNTPANIFLALDHCKSNYFTYLLHLSEVVQASNEYIKTSQELTNSSDTQGSWMGSILGMFNFFSE